MLASGWLAALVVLVAAVAEVEELDRDPHLPLLLDRCHPAAVEGLVGLLVGHLGLLVGLAGLAAEVGLVGLVGLVDLAADLVAVAADPAGLLVGLVGLLAAEAVLAGLEGLLVGLEDLLAVEASLVDPAVPVVLHFRLDLRCHHCRQVDCTVAAHFVLAVALRQHQMPVGGPATTGAALTAFCYSC
jgi:hypothetical protein